MPFPLALELDTRRPPHKCTLKHRGISQGDWCSACGCFPENLSLRRSASPNRICCIAYLLSVRIHTDEFRPSGAIEWLKSIHRRQSEAPAIAIANGTALLRRAALAGRGARLTSQTLENQKSEDKAKKAKDVKAVPF